MTGRPSPRVKRLEALVPIEPGTLGYWIRQHLAQLATRGYSPHTIRGRSVHLRMFAVWAAERDISRLEDVTPEILERYQRTLFYAKKADERPLTFHSQYDRLADVRRFFRWLLRQHVIKVNPADFLDLPRVERRLPKAILTAQEAEKVLALPRVTTTKGLRDRAILETLYATGIRRTELTRLKVEDLDLDGGTLTVRQGKGKKDRRIPLGERAAAWLARYLDEARPALVAGPDEGWLFLCSRNHSRYTPEWLAKLVHDYIERASLGKTGSCHLFRHTMATLMLEGGADLRFVQEMLGHADISTTQIYTRVAIAKLKEVHARTHPGAHLERKQTARGQAGDERTEAAEDQAELAGTAIDKE